MKIVRIIIPMTSNKWTYRFYDGTRYLSSFGPEKHDIIYNGIRYLINQKSDIAYVISHNYVKIKVDMILCL